MPELQSGDPRRLGSYDLLERLGEGGQGVVYLGRGPDGTEVAIKLLRADLTEDEMARSRFVREVQSAKQVARFCTAQVLEADVAGDRPYIVSELVPGQSLQKQVLEEGPRTGAALDRLAIGTVTALVAIHQAGIVHRDFKPHNVLIAPDGPRVIDFGIARALDAGSTASTKAIGTPAYMAPEQVMGAALTEAVDIFSWGSTMVFAATGQPPFGQDTIPAVINRILNQEPALDQVPDDLRGVIGDCLAKDPARRPTAQELMMRLIGGSNPAARPEESTQLDQAGPMAAAAVVGDDLPTAVLAEGEHMAGQTAAAAGGPTTGILPPVPGYPGYTEPGGGRTRKKPKGPIIGAVAAVATILLLVGGLVYVLNSKDDPSSDAPRTPATQVVPSSSETDDEPEESTGPERPKNTPSSSRPTDPPTSRPTNGPTSNPPTTSPGGGGGGGSTGGTGGGGTGSPGTGGGGASPGSGDQGGSQARPTP